MAGMVGEPRRGTPRGLSIALGLVLLVSMVPGIWADNDVDHYDIRFSNQEEDPEEAFEHGEVLNATKRAVRVQAATWNLTLQNSTLPEGSPSDLAADLIEAYGGSPSDVDLTKLDLLNSDAKEGLSMFLGGLIKLDEIWANRPADINDNEAAYRHTLEKALGAREAVLWGAFEFREHIDEDTLSLGKIDARPHLYVDLDGDEQHHDEEARFVVDTGGDDHYNNSAGGATNGVSAVLEANGTEEYRPQRSSGVTGGAAGERGNVDAPGGIGMLIDLDGSDTYWSPQGHGANGGAYGEALGLLVDTAGDDDHITGSHGTNGGAQGDLIVSRGFPGGGVVTPTSMGLLVDGDGHDTYGGPAVLDEADPQMLDQPPNTSEDDRLPGIEPPLDTAWAVTKGAHNNDTLVYTDKNNTTARNLTVGLRDLDPGEVPNTFHGETVLWGSPTLDAIRVHPDDPPSFIDSVENDTSVLYVDDTGQAQAEADEDHFPANGTPNDPIFPEQWSLGQMGVPDAWQTVRAEMDESGPLATHRPAACVIDSKVKEDHPDLEGDLATDSDPQRGHGTLVVGILGAVTNNTEGISGVAQPHLISKDWGGFSPSPPEVTSKIVECGQESANVISMSLSMPGHKYTELALEFAIANGAAALVAEGNVDSHAPGLANLRETVPVGCIDNASTEPTRCGDGEQKVENSNVGAVLEAPGDDIWATSAAENASDYGPYANGSAATSYAAPNAAGSASLVSRVEPGLDGSEIIHLLHNNGDAAPSGTDIEGQLVNASSSVEQAAALDSGVLGDAGVNGGGFAGGSGGLIDLTRKNGSDARHNDTYGSDAFATNGGAYLGGHGFLIDASGDDHYMADGNGVNGGVNGEKVESSIPEGVDTKQFKECEEWIKNGKIGDGSVEACTLPTDEQDRPFLTFGFLVDGGGTDTYEEDGTTTTDETDVDKGKVGVQVDV